MEKGAAETVWDSCVPSSRTDITVGRAEMPDAEGLGLMSKLIEKLGWAAASRDHKGALDALVLHSSTSSGGKISRREFVDWYLSYSFCLLS